MNNESYINIIEDSLSKLGETILSFFKIALLSRSVHNNSINKTEERDCVVLGNGPSLKTLIETHKDFLEDKDLIAVNYAVLSDYYTSIRPQYYIVADKAFFKDPVHCNRLFDTLAAKTDWDMTLFIPATAKSDPTWRLKLHKRPNIKFEYFNMTPVEGFNWFSHWAFDENLGLPRPRNVLIPAIMTALRLKPRNIYVAGADHSWLRDIYIGDDNRLYENFQHFYDQKTGSAYPETYHLHNMLYNLYITFKSYHIIEHYAKKIGIKIYNITEGSYIDAFERKKI